MSDPGKVLLLSHPHTPPRNSIVDRRSRWGEALDNLAPVIEQTSLLVTLMTRKKDIHSDRAPQPGTNTETPVNVFRSRHARNPQNADRCPRGAQQKASTSF